MKENNIEHQYLKLLKDILDNGVEKQTRNGETISVFGRQIRHDMKLGFPLLTTKKMYWKGIVTELLWFLRGDTNIKYLVDNDCHIWDGDAYKNWVNQFNISTDEIDEEFINGTHGHDASTNPPSKTYKRGAINCFLEGKRDKPDFFLTQEEFINKIKTDDEFAKKWGELGPVYGKQWRAWGVPRMESKGFDFDAAWEKSQKIWKSSNGMECGPSFETFCMSLLRSKEMGVAYGYHTQTDQITNLINDLKTNLDSRRLMVNAWNVGELDSMVLPPCHYGFQVYTRELSLNERNELLNKATDRNHKRENCFSDEEFERETLQDCKAFNIPTRAISLMWNQRSCDFPLGIPANIMSYAILLMMLAKQVNMIPEELIGNFGDCHIYKDQIEGVKEQLTREPYPLPSVKLSDKVVNDLSEYTYQDIILENYQSHPKIYFPLSN
jgi:thymidylate synthase